MIPAPCPGDVWAVDTGNHLAADLIRLGYELGHANEPALANHVVGVSHQDKAGTWWGIEGRPGGVGWVDLRRYQAQPWVKVGNSNATQPRTAAQRAAIVYAASGLLGTPYDWVGGITTDAARALGMAEVGDVIDRLFGNAKGDIVPAHVVCSSLYAYVYGRLGLACPAGDVETVTPGDWWSFNEKLGGTP